MKKLISTLLAVILLLSCMSVVSFAEEELTNIAPNGLAYCSSMKNSNWTPPNSINDAVYDWHGWEPKYPSVEPGQNTSLGFDGEYCGIKFLNNEYYEIHEIHMTIGLHALYRQNTVYKIQALVEGVWQDIVTLKDDMFTPRDTDSSDLDGDGDTSEKKYSSYDDAMERDTTNYHIGAELTYTLPTPVTTNNLRITVTEFAKNYPGGDVLIFPYIYEVELIGKRGVTPDISLPEGAEFSQNAAYNSIPQATSSSNLYYPFNAIDGKETTGWRPSSTEAGQSLTLELEKEYTVDKLKLNFGTVTGQPIDYKFKLEAFVDGAWQKIADGSAYDETTQSYITEYLLESPVKTNRVRLVFEDEIKTKPPTVYEFEVNIVGDRTYYLPTRFSSHQKSSSAKGNLAILGTAYASANLAPYSEPYFINDGMAYAGSDVWFSGTLEIPVSCGVKLDKTYTVNKVVVYCAEPNTIGDDVTRFNIVAKINGQYQIIDTGDSYNAEKVVENSYTRYTTVYEFPEGIVTDEIKLDFIRGDSTIPNVMELEIYSDSEIPSVFDGYPLSANDTQPVYTDVKINEQTPNPSDKNDVNDNNGDDDGNTSALIVGVSLCFVAAAVAIATPIVIKARKKSGTEAENTDSEQ